MYMKVNINTAAAVASGARQTETKFNVYLLFAER